jgi:hypothetical protein
VSPVQKYTNVGNTRAKFRDSFANPSVAQPNPANWDLVNGGNHIITQGGDSSGSSYLRISLDPFADDTEVSITSKDTFNLPARVGFGVSLSQRILGQEVFAGFVGCDPFDVVEKIATPVAQQIAASIVIASNVGTVTLPNHGFKGGDRVTMYGHVAPQLNVGPVVVTVVDANNFTVPITLANGTYTATGYVLLQDPLGLVRNGAGYLFENTTTTNASFVSRRNGAKFRTSNSTIATTTAVQTNTNPYTDAFNAAANNELYFAIDEVAFRSYAADGGGGMTGYGKYTQSVPDEDNEYKIQVRAKIMRASTRAVARILSATKSGTTTATIVTTAPHGLTSTDLVQVYGVRDQTNFPNLAAQTAITVIDPTTFTVVIGATTTGTSAGGAVFMNEGSVLAPGAIGQAVQAVSRTNGILTLTGSGTWSGLLPGEYVNVYGMTENGATVYEGAYKVLRLSTTLLELDAPGPDFGSITTGGQVIKRTDVRLHYARVIDYTRLGVEVLGGKGQTNDGNNAVPVTISGAATLSINSPAVTQSTGSSTNQWNAAGYGGFLVADVASAAITTTATTAAVTPGLVANVGTYAHSFNVIVTAVSGTTPTMDVGVEESIDNGTNWVRIYDFPRITANGAYSSPLLRATAGTRYRYVQTIAGTTPSFTRAINRITYSTDAPIIRQFIDRTIVPNTLNATTPGLYNVDGSTRLQAVINMGAITTTPAEFQFQGSDDGTNWYAIGASVTPAASTTAVLTVLDFIPKYARIYVKTAGVGATLGYVLIKAQGV